MDVKRLCDLWRDGNVHGKSIAQLAAWAGKITDDSDNSRDIRAFFRLVDDSLLLAEYLNQCLARGFEDAEFVLQDVINEIGIRLGFVVEPGRYRGKQNAIGFDGIWRSKGHAFVVEIKTSDVHSIRIETIAKYRRKLIEDSRLEEDTSSILIIVGNFDTDAFECQVRGSKHAWDIRLLSVGSLLKLLFTKEAVDDSSVFDRIIEVLQPRDFTKLDEIIELVFSAATEDERDLNDEEELAESIELESEDSPKKHARPVNFHPKCVERASEALGLNFIKDTKHGWISSSGSIKIQVGASKIHSPNLRPNFWFGIHPHQIHRLSGAEGTGYFVLGCGSESNVFIISVELMSKWIENYSRTKDSHWHIVIHEKDGKWFLGEHSTDENVDITEYLIA